MQTIHNNSCDIWHETDQLGIKLIAAFTTITSSLSVLGSVSILIPILIKKKCHSAELIPLLHLSTADFLASTLTLISMCLYFVHQDKSQIIQSCLMVAVMALAFFVSSFIFIILYASQAFVEILSLRNRGKVWRIFKTQRKLNIFTVFYILGWIIPTTVTLITYTNRTLHDPLNTSNCFTCIPLIHYYNRRNCQRDGDMSRFAKWWTERTPLFFGPQLFTMATVICLLSATMIINYRYSTRHTVFGAYKYQVLRTSRLGVLSFMFVFMFCWSPTLILNMVEYFNPSKKCSIFTLYVFQSLTAPLQGLLNAIVYGWRRRSFTDILSPYANNENSISDINRFFNGDISAIQTSYCPEADAIVVSKKPYIYDSINPPSSISPEMSKRKF